MKTDNIPHKIARSMRCMTFWLLLLGGFSLGFSQITPVAWYDFSDTLPSRDITGNGFDLNMNLNNLRASNQQPIQGSFFQTPDIGGGLQPHTSTHIDDTIQFDELSMEFWFRANKDFYGGEFLKWSEKAHFYLFDVGLTFYLYLDGGGFIEHTVRFDGTGPNDMHGFYDNQWHHIAGTFDTKTGTIQIYVDGLSPSGYTHHSGSQANLRQGGDFYPTTFFTSSISSADLDEIAIYDSVLTPNLVWQHYQDGLAGTVYAQTATLTPPAFPWNIANGNYDSLDYAAGYPFAIDPALQLANYPLPRHQPGHELPRMIPWIAKSIDLGIADQVPIPANLNTYGQSLKDYSVRLASEFNFYLGMGGASDYVGLDTTLATGQRDRGEFWLSQIGRQHAYDSLPRFVFTSYGQVNTEPYYPSLFAGVPMNVYNYPAFPPHCYGRNAAFAVQQPPRWTWEAMVSAASGRRDTLALDGMAMREHLKAMDIAMQGNSRLSLIGDNGEMLFRMPENFVTDDPIMNADFISSTLSNGDYQALRARQLRELVSERYLGFQDTLNGPLPDPPALYWYNVGGKVETSHFEYPFAAAINQFQDSVHRATPYFYPQTAARWRYGFTNVTGIQQVLEGRREELVAGSNRFFPAVSPGYNDRFTQTTDRRMLRPGQFLGLMKYLAMLGADSYALFMYEGRLPIIPGSHKAWHAATLAYAQGISSRIEPFFSDGYALPGDSAFVFGSTYSHTLNTGNPLDLVGARRLNNRPEFVLSGSIMKLNNFTGQGPKAKDVCFTLSDSTGVVFDTMSINIRAQGSSYVLDLSSQDTIFYQLDTWHEWSEPGHWCRDFAFEGEVVDEVIGGNVSRGTERLSPHMAGDFTDFTSWLNLPQGGSASYNFATRQTDQDSLRVWVRARVLGSNPAFIDVLYNGTSVAQLPIQPGTWQWYGLDNSQQAIWLQNLGITQHQIGLHPSTTGIQVDKVLLARSPDDFTAQAFSPVANAAATTVCNGEAIEVSASGGLPGGCLVYHWDFGDNVEAHTPTASHVYSYPGTYDVILTVTHPCLDSVAFDTIQVTIDAPLVDAGRDTFVCAGGSVQLNGQADYFFKWREADLVSSPILQTPIATLSENGYLHLDSWDPQTGCHASDSVYVTLVELEDVPDTVISYCNFNATGNITGPFPLTVQGGYHVWWEPDPRLSSDTIRTPIATVPNTLNPAVFTAYQTDICRCDTDTVMVTLVFGGATPETFATPDSLCEGDTTTLLVTGFQGQINWFRPTNSWLSSNSGASPRAVPAALGSMAFSPQPSIFEVRGTNCFGVADTLFDTLIVVPQPFLGRNNWQDTIWACSGTAITGLGIDQTRPQPSAFQWSPGVLFSDSTVLMPSITGPITQPTEISLTLHTTLGCPKVYTAILMPVGILPDTLYQCPNDSLSLFIGDGVSTVEWSPTSYFADPFSPTGTFSVPYDTTVYVSFDFGPCIKEVDSVHIIVHGLPQIAEDTLRACSGDTVDLNTTGSNPVVWGPMGTMVGDSTADTTWTLFTGQPFTLYVASCDSFFCPGFDSVLVTWQNAIQGTDTFNVCAGDSLDLFGLAGGVSCSWSPNIEISSVTNCNVTVWPTQDRYYYLDWVDAAGCFARDSVWITIDSAALTGQLLSLGDTICVGDSVQLAATGGTAYAWSPLLQAVSNPWASPSVSTTYTVTISNGNQCTVEDSVRISVDLTFPPALIVASADTICNGEAVGLTASGGNDYLWTGPGLVGVTGPVININPDSTSIYSVNVGDGGACRAEDSVLIFMDDCCYVPNMDLVIHNGKASDVIAALGCAPTVCSGIRIHVIDTLLIDVQSFALDSSTVMMDDSAVIWVPQGHQFTLANSTVKAACDSMWDCICIDSANARVKVQNSLVRDGIWGLRSLEGGQFAVENSRFKHNWIGITVDPFAGMHQGEVLGSRFTSKVSEMLPPFAGYVSEAGIYVNQVDSIRLGPDDWSDRNTFDSLGIGVLARHSNVWVTNGMFKNMSLKPDVKGNPGYGHYSTGIAAYGYTGVSAPPATYWMHVGEDSARACRFVDILQGIKVTYNNHLDAGFNTFRRNSLIGVRLELNHYNSLFVHNNNFVDCETGIKGTLNTGSKLYLNENRIVAAGNIPARGIWMSDLNIFGSNYPNGGGYHLNENTIRLSGYGIIGDALGGAEIARNVVKITGTFPSGTHGAAIVVGGSDKAKIRENNLRNLALPTDSIDGIAARLSNRLEINCNLMRDFHIGMRTFGSCDLSKIRLNEFRDGEKGLVLESNGIIGQQGDVGVPSGNKWTGNWSCGAVEKMAFTVNTNPSAQLFYVKNNASMNPDHSANFQCNGNNGNGNPIPFIPTNGLVINNCPSYPTSGGGVSNSPSMLAIANNSVNYAVLPNKSKYLDQQMLLDTLNANLPLCQSVQAYLTCHQGLVNSNMGALANAQKKIVTLEPSLALTYSTPITPVNSIEANHRTVNTLVQKLLENRDQFDVNDSLQLEQIASLCPLMDGRAVYIARSVLGLIAAPRLFDDNNCFGNEKMGQPASSPKVEHLQMVPNPASNQVKLLASMAGKVWIVDMKGHVTQSLDIQRGELDLNITNWSRGVYLFRYQMKSGETGSIRLAVQ